MSLVQVLVYGAPAHGDALGLEVITLTSHISRFTLRLGKDYKRKLSHDGRHVITPGLEGYHDKRWESLHQVAAVESLRTVVAGYYDSMNRFSGYVAYMPRWNVFKSGKVTINFGIGPTLIFRETWNRIPAYRDDGYYQESSGLLSGYQYKFIPGGDVNLHYTLDARREAVWSIIPGYPYVLTHAFGLRWRY